MNILCARSLFALPLVAAVTACSGDPAEPTIPAGVAAVAGDVQSGPANSDLAFAPSLRVTNTNGTPLANIPVTFRVASGGGTITGGDTSTDVLGVAKAGSWKLGAIGENTVIATVGAGSNLTYTFRAIALDPCASASMAIGQTVSGTLASTDCQSLKIDGAAGAARPVDRYDFTLSSQQAFSLTLSSPNIRIGMTLETTAGSFLQTRVMSALNTPYTGRGVLPAGSYRLSAFGTPASASTGSYSVAMASTSLSGCGDIMAVRGVDVAGAFSTDDCVSPITNNHYYDAYIVWLDAGQTINITVTPATQLEVFVGNAATGTRVINTTTGTGSYTATSSNYLVISLNGGQNKATGSYTLSLR
jgi:hypothetical protein